MEVSSLLYIGSFNVAKYLWSCDEDWDQSKESKNSQYKYKSFTIENRLDRIYPSLPAFIRRMIIYAAGYIDKELKRLGNSLNDEVTHFDHICWTSYFTIDKVKSACKTKAFDITSETLCECCFTAYVSDYQSNLTNEEIRRLRRLFGKYEDNVILYWLWYGRHYRSLSNHLSKYTMLYEGRTPIENTFQICVFLEYEVAVFYYWSKINTRQQLEQNSSILPALVFESDYLDFIELNELLPLHTFYFFWNRLDNYEQWEVVQNYFLDFCRYHLYHENGIEFLFGILELWTPTDVTSSEYFKLLRMSIDTNNLDLFVLFWKRKLAFLSFEAVGHLMWTLMLKRDDDFVLCTMIINDYDRRKVEVLNELDKRIECVKYNFNDRINAFLSAASIKHLRASGFPRNPEPRPDRSRNRSFRRYHRFNWR